VTRRRIAPRVTRIVIVIILVVNVNNLIAEMLPRSKLLAVAIAGVLGVLPSEAFLGQLSGLFPRLRRLFHLQGHLGIPLDPARQLNKIPWRNQMLLLLLPPTRGGGRVSNDCTGR
jgi:hypothetical protein